MPSDDDAGPVTVKKKTRVDGSREIPEEPFLDSKVPVWVIRGGDDGQGWGSTGAHVLDPLDKRRKMFHQGRTTATGRFITEYC